jgi:hypothetical protein
VGRRTSGPLGNGGCELRRIKWKARPLLRIRYGSEDVVSGFGKGADRALEARGRNQRVEPPSRRYGRAEGQHVPP